ncbi:hypothetical protein C8R43DRAFT_947316 [Mycena crocata]|nr:hypothetical protein C8R43DRAFT_947316 [Mycena crocata]
MPPRSLAQYFSFLPRSRIGRRWNARWRWISFFVTLADQPEQSFLTSWPALSYTGRAIMMDTLRHRIQNNPRAIRTALGFSRSVLDTAGKTIPSVQTLTHTIENLLRMIDVYEELLSNRQSLDELVISDMERNSPTFGHKISPGHEVSVISSSFETRLILSTARELQSCTADLQVQGKFDQKTDPAGDIVRLEIGRTAGTALPHPRIDFHMSPMTGSVGNMSDHGDTTDGNQLPEPAHPHVHRALWQASDERFTLFVTGGIGGSGGTGNVNGGSGGTGAGLIIKQYSSQGGTIQIQNHYHYHYH